MSNNTLDLKTEIMIGYIAVYYAAIVTNKSSVNLPRILFKQVLKFGHASMNLPFVFIIIIIMNVLNTHLRISMRLQ